MTLRRRTSLRPSAGTTFPREIKAEIRERDRGCLGPRVGMPGPCVGEVHADHIRASGALGKRSRHTADNGASLCVSHHDLKTREGRTWRPRLIDLVDALMGVHTHVDPVPGCEACYQAARAVPTPRSGSEIPAAASVGVAVRTGPDPERGAGPPPGASIEPRR